MSAPALDALHPNAQPNRFANVTGAMNRKHIPGKIRPTVHNRHSWPTPPDRNRRTQRLLRYEAAPAAQFARGLFGKLPRPREWLITRKVATWTRRSDSASGCDASKVPGRSNDNHDTNQLPVVCPQVGLC
jgi:hypothetical protein